MFVMLSYDLPGGTLVTRSINAGAVREVQLYPADVENGESRDQIWYALGDDEQGRTIRVAAGLGSSIYQGLVDRIAEAERKMRPVTFGFIAFPRRS